MIKAECLTSRWAPHDVWVAWEENRTALGRTKEEAVNQLTALQRSEVRRVEGGNFHHYWSPTREVVKFDSRGEDWSLLRACIDDAERRELKNEEVHCLQCNLPPDECFC